MQIIEKKHYIQIYGLDNNGEFFIRILRDCSQLQMQTNDNHAYIDINYRELKNIRDTITDVLDGFDSFNKAEENQVALTVIDTNYGIRATSRSSKKKVILRSNMSKESANDWVPCHHLKKSYTYFRVVNLNLKRNKS